MQEGVWSLYISFQNHNTQAGTGKFNYEASILDENPKAIKVPSSIGTLIIFEHVLLLTKHKRKLHTHAPNSCNAFNYLCHLS